MLTKIYISGFKSFQSFEMVFTPLTVVAGVNSSGKSNLFDALKLLGKLAETDLKTAFRDQRGNPIELFTQLGENQYSREMRFTVELLVNRNIKDNWGRTASLNITRLRYSLVLERKTTNLGLDDLAVKFEKLEKIKHEDDDWVKQILPANAINLSKTQKGGGSSKAFIDTNEINGVNQITIRQDGKRGGKPSPANSISQTVLSGVNSVDFPHAFAVKEEMRNWKFLQLNPEDLRSPTSQEIGMQDFITPSGKNLASTLFRIKSENSDNLMYISHKLNSFLPDYTDVKVYDEKENHQFIIKISGEENKVFSSRVLSEGTLRILALCILEYDDQHTGLLCFEEPENGIHPFRIEAMTDLLKELSTDFLDNELSLRQVIVNTHSPDLVAKTLRWNKDKNVSVWFSRQDSLIDDFGFGREKIKITRMSPVLKQEHSQLSLFKFNIAEQQLTLSEVKQYLRTENLEDILKGLS